MSIFFSSLLRHWHLIAVVVMALAIVLPTVFVFDGLIEFEYDRHRDAWETDGRPSGYLFFHAPEAALWSLNTHVLFLTWLFTTPTWAESSKSCLRSFRRMRILAVLWLFGFLLVGLAP